MSLYDEENPFLVQPRPFWEEEPVQIAQPVIEPIAPPAAPPPEVEGPGYSSPEEIVAKAAPPEVVGPGYASPKEIPAPEVEGPGFASVEEITGVKPPEEEGLLKKAGRVALATGQLLAPNLGQAKAVLEPETQKAAIAVADKTKNSLRSGWISGDVAQELQKQNPSLDYVAQQQRLIDTLKPDADFQKAWDDNATAQESFDAFKKDPVGNIAQLFGQSMGAMVRTTKDYAYKIPERTLQGAIAGTGVGAWFAGVGALPGAALGARGGLTLGMAEMNSMASYANEYAGSVISSLQESGVDVRNADQLKAAFSNPELMAPIRAKAEKKGVPVAFFDGLSGAMNGNLFAHPGKTLGKKAWEWSTELLVDALMGSTGEAAGQVASEGKITSPRSIAAEALMEPVASVPQVAVSRTMAGLDVLTQPLPATPQAVVAPDAPAVPPPIPPTPAEAFAPPPAGQAPPVTPPGAPPVEVPGAVPGEQPAYVNVGPGVPPPLPGDERFAPSSVTPPTIEAGPPTPQGDAVTQVVGEQNIGVTQVAQEKADTLQAAGAPKTAEAIQQVAKRSNTEATVSAADYLQQLQQQAADEAAEAAEKAATEAAKAAPAAEAPGAVKPGEFAQPGYTAVAPAAAPPAQGVSVPVMITRQMEADLLARGVPQEQINRMTPLQAHEALSAPPVPAPAQAPQPAPVTEPPAAVVVGGQVFTGPTLADATRAAHAAVGTDAMATAEQGWVGPDGQFTTHDVVTAYQALDTAINQSGGNMEHPAIAEAGAQLAQAQARNAEINGQIVLPTDEQAVATGIKGQEALISVRPSQELMAPLAGVNVTVEGVNAQGQPSTAQRPAAQALNEARNDRTTYSILLDCLR